MICIYKKSLLVWASLVGILLGFSTKSSKVFVVGDSISMEYGPYLQQALGPQITYGRKGDQVAIGQATDNGQHANGGHSGMVLAYLDSCAQHSDFRPDYLLVNCGLHDLKTDPQTGTKQVPLHQYSQNLRQIIELATRQKWSLVWISTTPIVDSIHNSRVRFRRYEQDVQAYNAAARELMEQHRVPIIDLHAFTRALGPSAYRDHAHYIPAVQRKQGEFVAEQFRQLLAD